MVCQCKLYLLFILNWNETIHSHLSSFHAIACVVLWLACSPRVWKIMDSTHSWVKKKSMKLVFAASLLSKQHKGERAKTQNQEIVSIQSDISTSELEVTN